MPSSAPRVDGRGMGLHDGVRHRQPRVWPRRRSGALARGSAGRRHGAPARRGDVAARVVVRRLRRARWGSSRRWNSRSGPLRPMGHVLAACATRGVRSDARGSDPGRRVTPYAMHLDDPGLTAAMGSLGFAPEGTAGRYALRVDVEADERGLARDGGRDRSGRRPVPGAELLPADAADHEWQERFRLLRVKRGGPSVVGAEVLLPVGELAAYLGDVERLGRAIDVHFMSYAHVVGDGLAVVMTMTYADETQTAAFVLSLGVVKLLHDLSAKRGGRPYGTGVWGAPHVRAHLAEPPLDEQARRKLATDPLGVMNPGKGVDRLRLMHPGFCGRGWAASPPPTPCRARLRPAMSGHPRPAGRRPDRRRPRARVGRRPPATRIAHLRPVRRLPRRVPHLPSGGLGVRLAPGTHGGGARPVRARRGGSGAMRPAAPAPAAHLTSTGPGSWAAAPCAAPAAPAARPPSTRAKCGWPRGPRWPTEGRPLEAYESARRPARAGEERGGGRQRRPPGLDRRPGGGDAGARRRRGRGVLLRGVRGLVLPPGRAGAAGLRRGAERGRGGRHRPGRRGVVLRLPPRSGGVRRRGAGVPRAQRARHHRPGREGAGDRLPLLPPRVRRRQRGRGAARRGRAGAACHPVHAGGGGAGTPRPGRGGGDGDLPRSLRPGAQPRHLRRTPRAAAAHPRPDLRRVGAYPRGGGLLRRRRRPAERRSGPDRAHRRPADRRGGRAREREILVSACQQCEQVLDAAVRRRGAPIRVVDLCELVWESLE